jgi:hypothetical protein
MVESCLYLDVFVPLSSSSGHADDLFSGMTHIDSVRAKSHEPSQDNCLHRYAALDGVATLLLGSPCGCSPVGIHEFEQPTYPHSTHSGGAKSLAT